MKFSNMPDSGAIKSFVLGMREHRSDFTTNVGEGPRMDAYNRGRQIGQRTDIAIHNARDLATHPFSLLVASFGAGAAAMALRNRRRNR